MLQALVDKKKIVISEAVIHEILQLNDVEGVVCLPNEEIFAGLAQMGVGKGFLRVETPLFESMLVVRDVAEEAEAQVPAQGDDVQEPGAEEVVTDVVPHTPIPPSLVIPSLPPHQPPCPPQLQDAKVPSLLFQHVLDTCSALARRVEGLENDKATQQLEIVKLKAREKDDEFEGRHADKQAEIYNIDLDHSFKVLSMQEDDTEVQEAVEIVTTAKLMTEVVTAAATQVVAATTPIPAAKPRILNITAAPAKAAKRRKLHEQAKEDEDLKKQLEVVDDEDDDVFIEATPIGRKVPIVDYEIVMINNKPRYKIIKADGTHQLYISFITLLKNFDREDLEDLWRIMKARFSTSKPTNFSDDYLLSTLKTMFKKTDGQDAMWRNH
nr:hypothetical protein [Tanacetum cinerariifolium]